MNAIIEIGVNGLEAFLVYQLLKSTIPDCQKRKFQKWGIIGIAFLVSIFNLIKLDSSIQVVCVLLVHIGYAFVAFGGDRAEKILWGSCYMLIAFIAERSALRIASLIYIQDILSTLHSSTERYLTMIIYICMIVALVESVCQMQKKRIDLPRQFQVALLVFLVSIVYCADLLSDIMFASYELSNQRILWISDAIFCLIIVMLFLLFYLIQKLSMFYQDKQKWMLECKKEEYMNKEYRNLQNTKDVLKRWEHDYRNQMQTLISLMDLKRYDKAKEYILSLQEGFNRNLFQVNTGDLILDMVLATKLQHADQNEIAIDLKICLEEPLPLQEQDITGLFGNLLDNAIEANLRVERSKRYLQIQIKPLHNMIAIRVVNCYDGIVQSEREQFISRKNGEGHGIGTRQIKDIVEKAGGFCKVEYTDERFIVQVVLPLEE